MSIEPSLLDMVIEYSESPDEDSFGTDHPLVLFCENLQLQLSVHVIGKQISGFNDKNYRHMKRVSQRLQTKKHINGSLVALRLATLNMKVLEDDYSGDSYYADWLHSDLIPGLLAGLAEYASEELKDDALKAKADEAIASYSEGIGI